MTTSKQWVLASRPEGAPTNENFRLETAELPQLSDGQLLVENTYASVDPYMRGRMNDVKSYIPPFQIDEPLTGTAIGTVTESRSERFKVGDTVRHFAGWRTHAVLNEDEVEPINTSIAPAESYLGILGVTGLTAYVGLTAVGEMKEGDVVFVSGAAGAVGSAAGQIAKHLGASKVIGSAGSAEKIDYIKGLGFDEAFNYKDGDVSGQLAKAAPEGIDVYFDNVGGDHLEAAIANANTFGRIAMCGAIAQYNDTEPAPGPRNLGLSIGKCLTLRGFVVGQYSHLAEEFQEKIAPLVVDGSISYETTVRDSIENMPDAFLELFSGGNTGKMIVKF
ncbi:MULTISPECIES: NADP-dependent oxidoreductase [unclassified Corynebacterium]|uniref:NADP-dependent oxidoreductase n=1 Tax=unclassified Corynebacterium TaxID=2624378 RepID=UPI00264BD322|nr:MULTISPECIES: NADP-dependent oxidoreductase [unclassified Corynebacterium]MDN8594499.1 NADP-dependent oxidoreductase [Corynebacterium sp. P4_F2]WKK55651.1 NADP-dependent oxidoreductase [Corynebacterium sp. P4-C1]WKK63061.1 NADP-dependent oxidoreductase [Corynebacterium sp. P8-C1]